MKLLRLSCKLTNKYIISTGADLGGGVHLKKLRRAEGGTIFWGVFRVKNHDFTPKNNIFSNFRPPPPWIRPCSIHHRLVKSYKNHCFCLFLN